MDLDEMVDHIDRKCPTRVASRVRRDPHYFYCANVKIIKLSSK